jgi:hypothetical protein
MQTVAAGEMKKERRPRREFEFRKGVCLLMLSQHIEECSLSKDMLEYFCSMFRCGFGVGGRIRILT